MHLALNMHGSLAGPANLLTSRGPFPSEAQARIAAMNASLYRFSIVVTGNRAEVVDLFEATDPLPPADRAGAQGERVAA